MFICGPCATEISLPGAFSTANAICVGCKNKGICFKVLNPDLKTKMALLFLKTKYHVKEKYAPKKKVRIQA